MKVEKKPIISGADQDYEVTFEKVKSYRMHEASIAINAIAAFNRQSFLEQKEDKSRASEKLSRVTGGLVAAGMDLFVIELNNEANNRSKAGVIYDDIQLPASLLGLSYLHSALYHFVDQTAEVVHLSVGSSMGDRDALDRTLQSLVADSMVAKLEAEGISKLPSFIKNPNGFGFGRDAAEAAVTSSLPNHT
jgi:hypothetical protein